MPEINDDNLISAAMTQLGAVFNPEENYFPCAEAKDALWTACQYLANALGITLTKPAVWASSSNIDTLVLAIARESHLRVRHVTLSGKWWQQDNGPLLAFEQASQQPVALIRVRSGYQLIDPMSGQARPLTPERAQTLTTTGYMFYRSFPDIPLNIFSILRFAFQGQKQELRRIILLQSGIGLLALLVPIVTGILLNNVIPNAQMSLLWQWLFALTICAVSVTCLTAAQILCFIRLRFKVNAYTQAAVWDRLLRLPLAFFKQFSPGDLTQRASGIDTIQQQLTSASLQIFLGGIFSILTLGLMFYYSPLLAVTALALLIVVILLTIASALIQLHYQRPIAFLRGQLAALSLQFLTSIAKLRVSHSEARIFTLWAHPFANKNRLFYKSALWQMYFTIIVTLFMLLGLSAIYALVGYGVVKMNFGSFIAFNAAFGQFMAAILAFTNIFIVFLQLTPQYERILPILQATSEEKTNDVALHSLTGAVALKAVSFRYQPESPWVINDITLEVHPGEMVAFAGATGCGKSTLIRLLLGFETPDSGQIFYDQHPLATLNLRTLREYTGVVLQNATLLAGTIFDYIRGAQIISLEDAWIAAEQAAIADDIKAMPMGMYTLIAECGKTLSVGQRQRLMIARALARKPRLLILDEATSALDNPTQAKVMRHIETLPITRIVVAHRLSTLECATRIYVMQAGQIIECGNYQELMAEKGLFADLARQQVV